MTERRKLSLGAVAERGERDAANRTRGWQVSPARAATLKERARNMRLNPTAAEARLWERLKDKGVGGFAFTRQVVMGSSIVDFACRSRWLVVETGAADESDAKLAELSDRKLTEVGVRVLRFSDAQVLEDTDAVVAAIRDELNKPFDRPKIRTNRIPDYAG